MIFRSAPLFQTRVRPFEVALLIKYLDEVGRREQSRYLSGFLTYIADVVLHSRMEENMSPVQMSHALEQAEALLSDIREHGDPL